jgi:phage-related protein
VSRGSIDVPLVSKFDPTGLKQAEGALKGFGSSLGKLAGLVAAAFSVRAITNFAKEAVGIAEAAATAQARLEAVAKATGTFGAETTKVTDRLAEFAKSQEMRLAVDDKVIKGVQAQLLSFKALGASADEVGGAFDRATVAAFDMAAAGFGSAEGNATALGKALENPIKGVTALARMGTTFTDQQREQIRVLQESGDLLGAQELILAEVESQYGGVAAATADASDKLAIAFENIKETAGAALLPVFAELVEGIVPVTEALGEELAGAFAELAPVLTDIVKALPTLVTSLFPLIPILGQVAGVFFQLIEKLMPVFVDILNMILPAVAELAPLIADALVMAFDALVPVLMQLIEAFMPIVQALLPVLSSLIVALAPILVKVINAFMPLLMLVLPLLVNLINALTPILIVAADILGVLIVRAVSYVVQAFKDFMAFLAPFTKFFESTFGGIGNFFYGIINSMIGMWEGFANAVINGVNFVIRALNRIQVSAPKWLTDLTGITSFGINIRELPSIALPRVALAQGGIVTGPMNALIGEAGPEAVIPLDKLPMGSTYNITINANVADARLGEVVVNAIKRYERTSGPVFASA